MLKRAAAIILSATIASVATVWVTRASRDPASLLFRLRVSAGLVPQNTSEADWLKRHYGPDRDSRNLEEWIIRDFFKDQKGGVFLDVGAAHYQVFSNTWYLESRLGWSGIAIDAQESYRAGYETHRPHTRFFAFFVSSRSDEMARLFLSTDHPGISSSDRAFTRSYGEVNAVVDVPTIALNDLLAREGIARFDLLSMDIELAEPAALAGLDLQRFHPALAVVEAHPQVRQQILDYFAANRYVVVGKYLRVDDQNLWFMPAGASVDAFPPERNPAEWLK